MKVKEESEKVGLKLNIQKTKIMASGPITSWQIDVETVRDFILGGSKITADVDCSPEIKRLLLLERKVMTNLDSILKSRDITCQQRSISSRLWFFHMVTYGCEIWTIKKVEWQRTDAFELWSWRRLLRVPWTARRSNQSILKEISLEYSSEKLMLKLKLQYFGHRLRRADSFEKPPMLGKIEGERRGDHRGWDGWMASLTQWTWVWVNSGSWWWTGRPGLLQSMESQRVGHDWGTKLNWFEKKKICYLSLCASEFNTWLGRRKYFFMRLWLGIYLSPLPYEPSPLPRQGVSLNMTPCFIRYSAKERASKAHSHSFLFCFGHLTVEMISPHFVIFLGPSHWVGLVLLKMVVA